MRLFDPDNIANPARCLTAATVLLVFAAGCRDSDDEVRQIRQRAQQRVQQASRPDHLQSVSDLLGDYVNLNEREAAGQISYHLNEWVATLPVPAPGPVEVPEIATTLDLIPRENLAQMIGADRFLPSDATFLRDSYVFDRLSGWLDTDVSDDPLLQAWMTQQQQSLPPADFDALQKAARLFDWVVRNIALEPEFLADPAQSPSYPMNMVYGGPGYRQTIYQTLWRGRGDRFQRAGVFTRLCQHAGIDAAVLAVRAGESADAVGLQPWAVGVLIGGKIYLFEPMLGIHVPGPGQQGIATLAEARKDASVMRRLDVAGYYDYPLDKGDIQQNIALLNIRPEQITRRMRRLQDALIGDARMSLHVDAAVVGEAFDDVAGIAGARLWNLPVLAEVYQARTAALAEQDPRFANQLATQWFVVLENSSGSGKNLSLARWHHLAGRFADSETSSDPGARTLYLNQRAPEFEIDELRTNLELQKAYGLRRGLGDDNETFESQIRQVQTLMRLSKRTATYWLSLLQYDDGRLETAVNWFGDRVLDDAQQSFWRPAATYNQARTLERTGSTDEAIELLKATEDAPQAHGNRLRSRLLGDQSES